jgi:hypothetical protein
MIFTKKPLELYRKPGLYLRHLPDKGRGVFCTSAIAKDEIIETSPVILLPQVQEDPLRETRLADYAFRTQKISSSLSVWDRLDATEGVTGVVMGLISFCNHAARPNAALEETEREHALLYTLRATENIAENTEICITYGDGWLAQRMSVKKL